LTRNSEEGRVDSGSRDAAHRSAGMTLYLYCHSAFQGRGAKEGVQNGFEAAMINAGSGKPWSSFQEISDKRKMNSRYDRRRNPCSIAF
jgi:hypothetical protein